MTKRVESLDYLRGLMAVAVMAYHYSMWTLGPQLGVLGKLGIYAVAAFYVLSGVSLGMVYRDRMHTGADLRSFWIRRAFRILPLFWLATAAALWMHPWTPTPDVWLNFTMGFALLNPSGAIATGAWSIGNEMVFYALLPFMVRKPRAAFIVSLALGAVYAWGRLTPDASLPSQWPVYAQPLNHLFLFAGGVAMVSMRRIRYPALLGLLAAAVFCAYPMAAQIGIVTGWGRVLLSACTLAAVLSVYQASPTFKGIPAKALAFLGQGCFSIYLLHPIVYHVVAQGVSGALLPFTAVAMTLGLSYLTYRRIEKPMMALGARLSEHKRFDEAARLHGGGVGAAGVLRPLE